MDSTICADSVKAVQEVLNHNMNHVPEGRAVWVNMAMLVERGGSSANLPLGEEGNPKFPPDGIGSAIPRIHVRRIQVLTPRGMPDRTGHRGVFGQGQRSERAIALAAAEMYLLGSATPRTKRVVESLCGLHVTQAEIEAAAGCLDNELTAWQTRPIGDIRILLLDQLTEQIRVGARVVACPIRVAVGIRGDGRRTILGAGISPADDHAPWRTFLRSLLDRGMHGLRLILSEELAGLRPARNELLRQVPWQRCQAELRRTAQRHVSMPGMTSEVDAMIQSIFNAATRLEAQRKLDAFLNAGQATCPELATWMKLNLADGLAIFDMPRTVQRRLRTAHGIQQLRRRIRRRARIIGIFPGAPSLHRLVSAVLMEISEDWEGSPRRLDLEG